MKHIFINTIIAISTSQILSLDNVRIARDLNVTPMAPCADWMPVFCWAAQRCTHTGTFPPTPANCKCWSVECWCMHILSHTAVKLQVKRPEEHHSDALDASLPRQSELTLTPPLIKKIMWGRYVSFLQSELEKGTQRINTSALPPTASFPS